MRSVAAFVLFAVAPGVGLAETQPADPQRPEQRFVLFQPGSVAPTAVPAPAAAKLAENKFQREFLYSRWVRLNEIPFASALPGDRVTVEVSEGESFELVINQVNNSADATFWYANFPGSPGSTLFVVFSRPKNSTREPTFLLAGFQIPLQGRQFQVATAEELPGWAMLREVKPGTGTHLDNSNDTGGPAWREEAKKEVERIQREQKEKESALRGEVENGVTK